MTTGINDTNSVKTIMGQRLREAREEIKLSRDKFSQLLNTFSDRPITNGKQEEMNAERLKQWEYGNNPIAVEWLPLLCRALNCDVGYLFGEYEEKTRIRADVAAETGLSEKSIKKMQRISAESEYIDILSALIEDSNFEYLMYLIGKRFEYSLSPVVPPIVKTENGETHLKNAKAFHNSVRKNEVKISLDGSNLVAQKSNLLDSLISSAIIDGMQSMATAHQKIKEGKKNG